MLMGAETDLFGLFILLVLLLGLSVYCWLTAWDIF
jgi:hypothetical protein